MAETKKENEANEFSKRIRKILRKRNNIKALERLNSIQNLMNRALKSNAKERLKG